MWYQNMVRYPTSKHKKLPSCRIYFLLKLRLLYVVGSFHTGILPYKKTNNRANMIKNGNVDSYLDLILFTRVFYALEYRPRVPPPYFHPCEIPSVPSLYQDRCLHGWKEIKFRYTTCINSWCGSQVNQSGYCVTPTLGIFKCQLRLLYVLEVCMPYIFYMLWKWMKTWNLASRNIYIY